MAKANVNVAPTMSVQHINTTPTTPITVPIFPTPTQSQSTANVSANVAGRAQTLMNNYNNNLAALTPSTTPSTSSGGGGGYVTSGVGSGNTYDEDGNIVRGLVTSGGGGGNTDSGTTNGSGGYREYNTPSGGGSVGGGSSTATAQSIYENYLAQILADQKAASEARQRALEENYNRALATLQAKHNNEVSNLQNSADDSMRQAYISYMLGQKGINQQLANQGINGGATESILANLYNNYGSNRNAIANQLQKGLAQLNADYNGNVASLANSYGNNLADVLADYYDSAASTKENYASKIASLLASQASANRSGGGSGSGSSSSSNVGMYRPGGLSDAIWNALKNNISLAQSGKKSQQELVDYMTAMGINSVDQYNVLAENGFTPNALPSNGTTPVGTGNGSSGVAITLPNQTAYNYVNTVNDMKRMRGQFTNSDDFYNWANNYIDRLKATYGISDAEVQKIVNAF